MRIRSTRNTLRFYKNHGWTSRKLLSCLLRGGVEKKMEGLLVYWTLKPNARLDTDKLAGMVTRVDRWYNGYPVETDREYLEKRARGWIN